MKTSDRDVRVLAHMIDYCNDISNALNRFNNDKKTFFKDVIFKHSCCMCLIQIGELVNHLSPEFKEKYNHIPWILIKATRNTITHNYGNIGLNVVWDTINKDIPPLKSFCEIVISEHEQISVEQLPTQSNDENELER